MTTKLVGAVLELPFKLLDGLVSQAFYTAETTAKPYRYPNRYWFDRSVELQRQWNEDKYRYRQQVQELERKYQKEIDRLKRQRDLQR